MWRANIRLPMTVLLALGLIGTSMEASFHQLRAAPQTPPQPATSPQIPADAWGDPLPAGALLRLGTIRFTHADVAKVLFAPDGKTLASAGGFHDRTIRLWDPNSGAELHVLPGHRNGALAVAFAPDSKTLVSGSADKPIRLWNVTTGKEVRTFAGHQNGTWVAAFAPDGETLGSAGGDNMIRLWSVATGLEIRSWPTRQRRVMSLAFAPDGKALASASEDGSIRLWNFTGKEIHTLAGHEEYVWSIAFAPDGKTLASAGEDSTIRFWNPATGGEIRTLANPGNVSVGSIAFAPDGETLVAAGRDNTIRLWAVSTGKEIRSWKPSPWGVLSAAFAPDGKSLASASSDGLIRLWDPADGKEIRPRSGHRSNVRALAFGSDGKTLATLDAGTVRFWDSARGEVIRSLTTRPEMASGGCAAMLSTPDGKTLATLNHGDGGLGLWNAATGERIRARNIETVKYLRSIAVAPDGKTLALGTNEIRLWDVEKGLVVRTLTGHPSGVTTLAFAPDGKTLASVGYDSTVRLWDAGSGQEFHTLWHPAQVEVIAFAPDGKTLASTGGNFDRTVRLWDVGAGKQLLTLTGHTMPVRTVAFAPDGKILASGGDERTIRLWETATGKEIRTLTGHRGSVQSVLFAPDGKTLASGSMDTTGLVWRLREGSPGDAKLSDRDLEALWTDLAGEDAVLAYRAIDGLAAVPRQSGPFLRQRLPAPRLAPDPRQLVRLIADLESDQFAVRQRATQELEKLGDAAEPALRAAVVGKPSLETLQRLEQLLETAMVIGVEELRWQRAIQALERMGHAAPKSLLELLVNDAPSLRLRQQAAGALKRLARE